MTNSIIDDFDSIRRRLEQLEKVHRAAPDCECGEAPTWRQCAPSVVDYSERNFDSPKVNPAPPPAQASGASAPAPSTTLVQVNCTQCTDTGMFVDSQGYTQFCRCPAGAASRRGGKSF